MLDSDEAYYKQHGEPLFSSHMIDLSEESVYSAVFVSFLDIWLREDRVLAPALSGYQSQTALLTPSVI